MSFDLASHHRKHFTREILSSSPGKIHAQHAVARRRGVSMTTIRNPGAGSQKFR